MSWGEKPPKEQVDAARSRISFTTDPETGKQDIHVRLLNGADMVLSPIALVAWIDSQHPGT